jgi:nicastrin
MWRALHCTLVSILFARASSRSSSSSTPLDEPFQASFKNLPHSPCVTLYHRNGRIGCGTLDREGQSGPLVFYDGSTSISTQEKFVAVIEEKALSATTIKALLKYNTYGNLMGVLVLNSTDVEDEDLDDWTSMGTQYPLGYGTPSAALTYGDNQFPWNGNGDGLIQYDLFGVPMAYVNGYEASNYLREIGQDNTQASKIVADFNYYMGPDGITTKECLGWMDSANNKWSPKCLPLGGTSVWGFAGSPPTSSSSSSGGRRREAEASQQQSNYVGGGDGRPAVIIGTGIDATSMFHDLAPGANTAAANTLTLMMAAYLIGQNVMDATLDALPNRIVFGFFQGESYGYMGSRSFLKDVMGFECNDGMTKLSVSNNGKSELACMYPLRPSLKFMDIGNIAGMLTVDQVGVPLSDGVLYYHNDGSGGMGTFLANVLKYSSTNDYTVVASAAESQGNYPYPPTPLTALQSLTEGGIGGTVLSGYDYVFTKRPPYQSHMDADTFVSMNFRSIAASATLVARAALAAAYDDGGFDYATAAKYAANKIPELSYNNEVLVELGDCLFQNGNCDMLKRYAGMEAINERIRTGGVVSTGYSLGMPASFYVGVYNINRGQPFVQVGENRYGAYNGDKYGSHKTDVVTVQPIAFVQALRNMLSDFLGRGSTNANGSEPNKKTCHKQSDCSSVSFCAASGDEVTCSASKVCVCQRSHYHHALDEAIQPALNNFSGYFVIDENDQGISPLYSEPFWSSDVGIKMFRNTGNHPGWAALGFGLVVGIVCFFGSLVVKISMKKSKVY